MAAQVIIYDLAGRLSVQGADVAARDLGKVGKAAKGVKQGLSDLKAVGGSLAHAATGIAIMGVGASAALGKMAHSALEFEQKMAYVSALVGGKNVDDFKRFELAARGAGITTMKSSTEVAEAIYEIRKAGFTTEETLSFLNPALNLSTLESIKVSKAAEIAASAVRGFGIDAHQAGNVVDAMAFTSKNTAASIGNLGDGLRYSSATARQLGMDYKDVLVWLGLLNNANLKGSVAGTTLNSALLRLAGASIRGQKYVKELGISLVYTTGAMKGKTKSALDLIEEMGNKYQSILGKEGQVVATRKFMRALGQVGGKAVLAAFEAKAYPEMVQRLRGIYDAKELPGFAMHLAQRRFESTLGTVELLKNAFASFSIEISKANLFGGAFSEHIHKALGVMRLAAAAVGGYKISKRTDIMAMFGIGEGTAVKVEKAIAGIKRGISEAVAYAEKMYKRAASYLGKKAGGMGIENVAATATKVVLALAALGPAIFAAIPVVYTLTGSLGALFSAGKLLASPAGGILGITALLSALAGHDFFRDNKRSFFESMVVGFGKIADSAKPILGIVNDLGKALGPSGIIATFFGLKLATSKSVRTAAGTAIAGLRGHLPGPLGAVAGAVGTAVTNALPVQVVNWPLSMSTGGLGSVLSGTATPAAGAGTAAAGAVPGSLAAAGIGNIAIASVGSLVIGGMIGTYFDNATRMSDRLSSKGPLTTLASTAFLLGPGGLLSAFGVTGKLDKLFGWNQKSPREQTEENDRTGRIYAQNQRIQQAMAENRAMRDAWNAGQSMYKGEMLSLPMVVRRNQENLHGTGLDEKGLASAWATNSTYWNRPLPTEGAQKLAETELLRTLQRIDSLSGETAKASTQLPPLEQQWRDRELQTLQLQVDKLDSILQSLAGEKRMYVEQKIMLDGKQVASGYQDLLVSNAARSGRTPGDNNSSQPEDESRSFSE